MMKPLHPVKPLVLVMIGVPGAGKSFFARKFSETFSAPVVSYDRIRHELYDSPDFNKAEQATVERIALCLAEELFKTNRTFIVDGGGTTRTERLNLKKQAQAAGFGVLLVWAQTDKDTARYRSLKRSSRRADDVYNQSLSLEQYEQLAKRFTPPASNESRVVISGKHTYTVQAKAVLRKLAAGRPDQVPARVLTDRDAESRPSQRAEHRPGPRGIIVR